MDTLARKGEGIGEPRVQSVSPIPNAFLESVPEVRVILSKPIDPQSVSRYSFLVAPVADSALTGAKSTQIQSDIEKGKLVGLEGSYRVSQDRKEIIWSPQSPLTPQPYQVILTSAIQTPDRFPLSQTPGNGTQFFVSGFTLAPNTPAQSGVSGAPSSPPPEILMINEFFYDPLESETDGFIFVELYGTPGSNLHGYVVRFVNGSDGKKTGEVTLNPASVIPEDGYFVIADTKTGSASETRVANADFLSNFDPQNGPDSVQLIAPDGALVDVVGYGEGLAASDGEGRRLWEGESAADCASGFSLTRVTQRDTDDNRQDFVVNERPSPGNGEVMNAGLADDPQSAETSDDMPRVRFSEVVTDPQRDWNDTSGGNGVAFDPFPGAGTVGSSDEWLELRNATEQTVDLSGWRIEMNDGSDEFLELTPVSSSVLLFSDGGALDQFHADEFLVIGNPPGEMNNEIDLQLFNAQDELIDEINVINANANAIGDESYSLDEENFWEMGSANPTFGD